MKKGSCILCGKKTEKLLLCRECKGNPFLVEDLRNILAKRGRYELFKSTYFNNYAEVENLNTSSFWDESFAVPLAFKDQDSMTKEKIDTVISFLPKEACKILDLGIGQGYLEDRLEELPYSHALHGIDISSKAIDRANKKFKGNFVVGDVFSIDSLYKDNSFDVIIALELIEHIPPTKIFSLFNKIYSVLRKNGMLIISTPLNEGLRYKKVNPSGHVREYTISIIETELLLSGFKVSNKKVLYAFKNFYTLKKLLSKFLKNRWKPNNLVIKAIKD